MTLDRKTPSLSDQAMDWLILIRESPEDTAIQSAFEKWILEAPEHRREWEKTCQMWQALAEVPSFHKRKLGSIATAAPASPRRIRSRIVGGIAAAGTMLCLVALSGPSLLIRLQADYRSETAQSRNVILEDGSTVLLAPDSAIALAFSGNRRGVILLKGEAFFDVAPDKERPFAVEGGGLTVEVLGTAFDVRIGADDTEVALARGAIKASPEVPSAPDHILAPGDVLTLDRASGEITEATIAISEIGSWREGRLYVVDQTISSVIEQIQRYHPALISVPDRALARQKVTGIYDLSSPDEALGALVDPYGGKVRKVSDYIRIVTRL
ncbi:FecR family protein [Agrobacterium sp. OT33]|uniref:FecR family protein n=1 Tax=Agrobacterium sp. OT33 TaxID=2815338 RepID=UPI001A8D1A8A|nr:FecR family protein [Agrobacterium sp. OT33]MBO0128372.1 FecR family protein [Agrobacterium sp. OT33]